MGLFLLAEVLLLLSMLYSTIYKMMPLIKRMICCYSDGDDSGVVKTSVTAPATGMCTAGWGSMHRICVMHTRPVWMVRCAPQCGVDATWLV